MLNIEWNGGFTVKSVDTSTRHTRELANENASNKIHSSRSTE
jgi:hypothetical protein